MLESVVSKIRNTQFANPPASASALESARVRGVPNPLIDLYGLANGMLLGDGDDFSSTDGRTFRLSIPPIEDLITVQDYGYVDEDAPLYGQTASWWQIVDYGDANWLVLDATREGNGRILDVFHEEVGYTECHAIIADSVAVLLERLLRFGGADWFGNDEWQASGYV